MTQCIAFQADRLVAEGALADVVRALKIAAASPDQAIHVFDLATSAPIDLDLRGTTEDALARLPQAAAESGNVERRGPGRPRLGVVAREVTLLPRHWDWLATQPGGASVALRKLVEQARGAQAGKDRFRAAADAAYRFATVMAGNRPHYEEAMRALFARDRLGFETMTQDWPAAIRDHARRLAAPAFDSPVAP